MNARAAIPLIDQRSDDPAESEHAPTEMARGIPIRAISRAISVLQAINRGGSLNLMEIASTSGVPYPTACRIVQTLVHEGLIEREEGRKHYRPTALVQTLSHGYQSDGALLRAARPHIRDLTKKIGWPITISTHVGSTMVLRESTHSQTSLTFNEYSPGYAMPILECAAGLVYLAFADATERDTILLHLGRTIDDETRSLLGMAKESGLLEATRSSGYAARVYNRFTRNPGKTSSIAVPLMRDGNVAGAMTVAFFASSLDVRDAIRSLLPLLLECARDIGADLDAPAQPGRTA